MGRKVTTPPLQGGDRHPPELENKTMDCPHCHKTIPDATIRPEAARILGSATSGNRTTGDAKREAQRKSVEARNRNLAERQNAPRG